MPRIGRTQRLLLLASLLGAPVSGRSAPAPLLLTGEGGVAKSLSQKELAALPQTEVALELPFERASPEVPP